MPASKIQMLINKVDLKPANTKFLADHVWNNYHDSMKALQEVVVLFMADFNQHPVIDTGYMVSQDANHIREQFNMHIGGTLVTSVEVIQSDKYVKENTPNRIATERNDVLDSFDAFADPYKKVIYENRDKELISPVLLFAVRRLLGELYSAMQKCKGLVYFSQQAWEHGTSFQVVCYPDAEQKDLMLNVVIHSPRVESVVALS